MSKAAINTLSTLAITSGCSSYIGNWCDRQENTEFINEVRTLADAISKNLLELLGSWPCQVNDKDKQKIAQILNTFENMVLSKMSGWRPAVIITITTALLSDLQVNIKSDRKKLLDYAIDNFAKLYDMFNEEDMESDIVIEETQIVLDAWYKAMEG